MTKSKTGIEGLWVLEFPVSRDERGGTTKIYSNDGFASLELHTSWTQTLRVRNAVKGTLRGMHWQAEPEPEIKLIYCLRGRVFDVIVDIRPNSPTNGGWFGRELTEDESVALYVPGGMAHGYLTLEDDSDLLYQIAGEYRPELQRSLRWDDPEIAIPWPLSPTRISERDAAAPLFCDLNKR